MLDLLYLGMTFRRGLHAIRVQLGAGEILQEGEGLFIRPSRLIRAAAGRGIENIGYRDYPRFQRDVPALAAIGIA